jgi:tRNA dimethylallyltransferase
LELSAKAVSKKIFIIVGPTAVGKTAFAIEAAKLLNTDIISADSRQCFKELNIGVAKPTEKELQQAKHYFTNSHSIHDEVNAAVFEQYALNAVNEIFRGKDAAVMVGGTGLYIKAFCEGLDEIPEVENRIRNSIIQQYEENGLDWLQKEVQEKDPQFWKVAEQQNPQRLMRALEVMESTGRSITSFRKRDKANRPFEIIKIGLELPRQQLYDRINKRVDKMVEQGLVEEAKALFPFRHLNALQTVGYRELFDHFENKFSFEQAITETKKNTRHYAKRQLTWFKRDDSIHWFHPSTSPERVLSQFSKH